MTPKQKIAAAISGSILVALGIYQTVTINNEEVPVSRIWSYQSHEGKTFTDVDPACFSDSVIVGACFYQYTPYTQVFPDGIKNLILKDCNLDNVDMPEGVTVVGGTNKHFVGATDGEDWIVDREGNKLYPRDSARYLAFGLSIDPHDLPADPLPEPITYTRDPEIVAQRAIDSLANDREALREILRADGVLAEAQEVTP